MAFDDPNLVANAGLMLPGTLAQKLGVSDIIDGRVDLSGRVGGANGGIKAMTDSPQAKSSNGKWRCQSSRSSWASAWHGEVPA